MKTVFLRLLVANDKAAALRAAINKPDSSAEVRFELSSSLFLNVETSPFAYWISKPILRLFESPRRLRDHAQTRCGMSTLDDFRFVRLRTEHGCTGLVSWVPYVKGNTYRPFFDSLETSVNWGAHGEELKVYVEQKVGSASRKIQAESFYFQPGVSWVRRTHRLCVRILPRGCIFTGGAQAAFDSRFNERATLCLLGLLSSSIFDSLTKTSAGRTGDAVQFESGMLGRVPLPESHDFGAELDGLAPLAERGWSLARSLTNTIETSSAFTLPALLQVTGATLGSRVVGLLDRVAETNAQLARIQAKIDSRCFALYDIDVTDRTRIDHGLDSVQDQVEPVEREPDEVDIEPMVASLLSWAIGTAFGRFDIRLATGARALPDEPEPFDPLPACSAGMLTGDDGLPAATAPADYPIPLPHDGVLVDDPGHPQDLMARVRAVFAVVFGDDGNERLLEAESHLGRINESLRAWIAKRFFALHIKRYSRSRRKAPIYWQLSTASGSYSVWCDYHRLSNDTLFRVAQDYVTPKVAHEERKLNAMLQDAGPDPSSAERKEIDAQNVLMAELRALEGEVKRVAPLWRPNLNDGAIIHFAPLWRLVPHEKSWQRDCKKVWEKLCKGDYDWAHLAMHLWPERVVPRCAKDRSLAIAHGLEDPLWAQGDDGKWCRRLVGPEELAELILARSSTAVKAALGSLLTAPASSGGSKRRRKRGGA